MMFKLSIDAEEDIKALIDVILQDRPSAATKVVSNLMSAFEQLASHPLSGHVRTDLTAKPLRFLTVHQYAIIYEPTTNPLTIARVLHWRQDIEGVLRDVS